MTAVIRVDTQPTDSDMGWAGDAVAPSRVCDDPLCLLASAIFRTGILVNATLEKACHSIEFQPSATAAHPGNYVSRYLSTPDQTPHDFSWMGILGPFGPLSTGNQDPQQAEK